MGLYGYKPALSSFTVKSGIASVLSGAATVLQLLTDPTLIHDVGLWITAASALLGGLGSIWGRVAARQKIGPPSPPTAPPATLALLVLLPAMLLLGGCQLFQSPAGPYVAADRATYGAVAPEFAAYVAADPNLTTDEKERRNNTIRTWELRIGQAEAAAQQQVAQAAQPIKPLSAPTLPIAPPSPSTSEPPFERP